jgi:hypothetical protein
MVDRQARDEENGGVAASVRFAEPPSERSSPSSMFPYLSFIVTHSNDILIISSNVKLLLRNSNLGSLEVNLALSM